MKAFVQAHWKKLAAAVLLTAAGWLATGQVDVKPLLQLFQSTPAAVQTGDAG